MHRPPARIGGDDVAVAGVHLPCNQVAGWNNRAVGERTEALCAICCCAIFLTTYLRIFPHMEGGRQGRVSLTLKEFICKLTFPLLYLCLFKFGQSHQLTHKPILQYVQYTQRPYSLVYCTVHMVRMQNVFNA